MRALRRFAGSAYVERVRQLSGVTLPQSSFAQVLSKELLGALEGQVDAAAPAELLGASPSFDLSDADYQAVVREGLFGGFEIFQLRGHALYLVGMNYADVPAANLWKMLEWARPELVLLHLPPDEVVRDFSLNVRNPVSSAFSNRLYFAQLRVEPGGLCLNRAELGRARAELEEATGMELAACAPAPSTVSDYSCRAKLTDAVVAVSALFSQKRQVPVVLADIPDIVQRQKLVCPLTVSQLRQMLGQAVLDGVFNPDLAPALPLHLAAVSQPGLLLRPSDHYTASLLQYVLHRRPARRVLAFLGSNQARTVKSLLLGRTPLAIADSLETPAPRANVLGEAPLEDLVEKLAIYDVLKHGPRCGERAELRYRNTWALVEKFGGLEASDPKAKYYAYLYRKLVEEYVKRYYAHRAEAEKKLQESFAQTVMRNPQP